MTGDSPAKGEGDDQSGSTLQQRKLTGEVKKLEQEIEKLDQENRVLRRPFSRPAAWLPIVVAAVSVVSLWVQWTTSSLREEKALLEAAQALDEAKKERGQVEAGLEQVEKRLHKYKIQLLRKVVENLENTRDAVQQYTLGNWQKVIGLRDGNRAVEELLSLMLNVGLLPPSLDDDLVKLREHYKEWLDVYKSQFRDGVARPHRELIFVGTFPTESEASIKRCLADLEAGRADCRY